MAIEYEIDGSPCSTHDEGLVILPLYFTPEDQFFEDDRIEDISSNEGGPSHRYNDVHFIDEHDMGMHY